MIDNKVEKLETKIEDLQEEFADSKQVLISISKDMHVMSQTSVRMETALSKLLETEVKFQLHAQEMKQFQKEQGDLIKHLFKRVEKIEAAVKVVDKDHEVVERLASTFWKALGWTATTFAGFVIMSLIYIAEHGGLSK
jgi:hypothetical protein